MCFVDHKQQIVNPLGRSAYQTRINGYGVTHMNFPQIMNVVLEVKAARVMLLMITYSQTKPGHQLITGIVEYMQIIPHVHMIVSITE